MRNSTPAERPFVDRGSVRAWLPLSGLGGLITCLGVLACSGMRSGSDTAAEELPGMVALDRAGAELVIHSAGLDALLADPRDAGLLRALSQLDERLLELPAELGGGAPPPGLLEFLFEALGSPWTLQLALTDTGNDLDEVPAQVQWTVHAGSTERAGALATRFAGLLGLFALPSSRSQDRPELIEVELPMGSLFHGTAEGGTSFLLTFGPPQDPVRGLEGTTFAMGMKMSEFFGRIARFVPADEPEFELMREQLELYGLLGGPPVELELIVSPEGDHNRIDSRYRNWAHGAAMMGALPTGPIPAEALRRVPSDATYVSLSKSEPTMVLAILRMVAKEQFEGMLAAIRGHLGLDLGADFLEPLGQTFGLYLADSSGGGDLLSGVAFMEVDDPARLQATLDKLAAHVNEWAAEGAKGRLRVRPFEHGGIGGLTLDFPGLPVPLSPSLALADGYLVMGATPQALVAALDQARGPDRGLRAHPLVRLAAPGSLDDLQALMLVDSARFARSGYGLAGLVATALANGVRSTSDPRRDPGLVLPPFAELLAGARPTLLVSRIEGQDLVSSGTADRSAMLHLAAVLGAAPSLTGVFVVAGGLAAVVGRSAQEHGLLEDFDDFDSEDYDSEDYEDSDDYASPEESRVVADLDAILGALHGFAIENDGRYPDSLQELITPDEDGFTWLEPAEIPLDPWGNPYLYETDGEDVRVLTYGADGLPGGEGLARDIDNFDYEDPDDYDWLDGEEPWMEIEEEDPDEGG